MTDNGEEPSSHSPFPQHPAAISFTPPHYSMHVDTNTEGTASLFLPFFPLPSVPPTSWLQTPVGVKAVSYQVKINQNLLSFLSNPEGKR